MADEIVDQADEQDTRRIGHARDGEYERIRGLVTALDSGVVDYENSLGLSDVQIDWLTSLTPGMRVAIRKATNEQLADHIRGRHPIGGLLAYDRGSIAEFRRAMSKTRNQTMIWITHPHSGWRRD